MFKTLEAFKSLKEGSKKKYLYTKKWLNIPSRRVVRSRLERYAVGDIVMSQWTPALRGWYPGVVAKVDLIRDVYQIKYDDGDVESNVGRERLRKCDDDDDLSDDDDLLSVMSSTTDKYDTDDKQKCNGWIVKAYKQTLGGKQLRGLVIDACKLNTTRALLAGDVLRSENDVLHVINNDAKEMEKMIKNFSEVQKECRGYVTLSSCISGDFLSRCKSRGERLNLVFLDYCCTFETMKRSGDLEVLFGSDGLWRDGEGVFGLTLSLRGKESWKVQQVEILMYIDSVINRGGVMEHRLFSEEQYGQMIFYSFIVKKM
jgi:hypothetical protein